MKEFLKNAWETLVTYYQAYSNFVHSILPNEAGDFVVILIDITIVVIILKFLAQSAFKSGDE
jgi:hypothetical protein